MMLWIKYATTAALVFYAWDILNRRLGTWWARLIQLALIVAALGWMYGL